MLNYTINDWKKWFSEYKFEEINKYKNIEVGSLIKLKEKYSYQTNIICFVFSIYKKYTDTDAIVLFIVNSKTYISNAGNLEYYDVVSQ